jgi:pSer/pThr/pTyr-binding forkhead associated (FHA) protein
MSDISGALLLGLRFSLAIVLYAFLGWSILTIWRELKQLAISTSNRQIPAIYLTAVQNTKQLDKMKFNFPQIYIGRDPSCEFYLDNSTVSSKHSRIYYHLDQWWIEDLKSSNGTTINDQPVVIPTVLTDNDILRCGEVEINVAFSN